MINLKFDEKDRDNFFPLTATRKVGEIKCGVFTLAERSALLQGEKGPEQAVHYLWDLISLLPQVLEEDIELVRKKSFGITGKIHPSAVLYDKERIWVEKDAEVEALAVLDARSGPIYIGKGTIIRPQAYLRGPLMIGENCRIGGEVIHSIFHANSNKAHYGFLGHSYIGEWVNLGAGTTNSNLKNTYGTVKVEIGGKVHDSGQQFLGCFIGDHAKTGIGTLINTGTVIGVGANVLGGKPTPKMIPNFAWGEKGNIEWDKFLEIVQRVYSRRGNKLSAAEEKSLRELYLS